MKRRWPLLLALALTWAALGPRPADNTPYRDSGYWRAALATLEG